MSKRLYIFFLGLLTLAFSCDKESDPLLLDECGSQYSLYDYYTDEKGNEGIVSYIAYRKNAVKFIIVISLDETKAAWGPGGECIGRPDSLSHFILNGSTYSLSVMQNMKISGIDRYPAQAWCDRKNGDDAIPYSGSWRLPSSMEFYNIVQKSSLEELNLAISSHGGQPLTEDLYWTSTEDFDGYFDLPFSEDEDYDCMNRAVTCTPGWAVPSRKDRWLKKNCHRVRAVKYIYYYDY